MTTYLHITQILISAALILVILVQAKGMGGGVFGASTSVFRTRRGLERLLFRFTILLAILFLIVSMLSVRLLS